MALTVFNDRILVIPQEAEKTSAGGIVLPGASQQEFKIGTVKAVASTRFEHGRYINNEVKVGDVVYYDRYTRISEELHLISISNVLCYERSEEEEHEGDADEFEDDGFGEEA